MKLFAMFIAICWLNTSLAEVTAAQCSSEYDKCKKRAENMFNKKPCRKARAACEQQVAKGTQNSTKNRMLNGDPAPATALSGREAAEQRLRERNGEALQVSGGATGYPYGSQQNPGQAPDQMSVARKKAEAERRMKERQRAQAPAANGSSGMRESVKSN